MAREPEVGSLDLESETPCCIQLQGEACARHGPAVERPAPEGCAGCAALREQLARTLRVLDLCNMRFDQSNEPWPGFPWAEVDAALKPAPASPKESRRHAD